MFNLNFLCQSFKKYLCQWKLCKKLCCLYHHFGKVDSSFVLSFVKIQEIWVNNFLFIYALFFFRICPLLFSSFLLCMCMTNDENSIDIILTYHPSIGSWDGQCATQVIQEAWGFTGSNPTECMSFSHLFEYLYNHIIKAL